MFSLHSFLHSTPKSLHLNIHLHLIHTQRHPREEHKARMISTRDDGTENQETSTPSTLQVGGQARAECLKCLNQPDLKLDCASQSRGIVDSLVPASLVFPASEIDLRRFVYLLFYAYGRGCDVTALPCWERGA